MGNKSIYTSWCAQQQHLPLFYQPWWLDAVCQPGTWDVAVVRHGGGIITGVWPYYLRHYYGMPVIRMPYLTPYLGPWLDTPPISNAHKRRSHYNRTCLALIDQFPQYYYLQQMWHPSMKQLLPFMWRNFRPTTRYTFQFSQGFDVSTLYQKLEHKVRVQIEKADQEVKLGPSEDLELLYSLVGKSITSRGHQVPFDLQFLAAIDAALKQHDQRILYIARNKQDQPCAAIYLVWDNLCVYALMIGADPQYHSTGAVQRLLWEGIRLAAAKECTFDFEGSMVPSIFQMFRGFHATMVPYAGISHSVHSFIDLLVTWKQGRTPL